MNKEDQKPAVLNILAAAGEGLLFSSEIDAFPEPFFWPHATPARPTPELLHEFAGLAENSSVGTVSLAAFFKSATRDEEWHNEQEKAEAAKFRQLVRTLRDNLDGIRVFLVGETKKDVYIVGRVEGGYAGLKTQVVET